MGRGRSTLFLFVAHNTDMTIQSVGYDLKSEGFSGCKEVKKGRQPVAAAPFVS